MGTKWGPEWERVKNYRLELYYYKSLSPSDYKSAIKGNVLG
jgi:hypothetical protein